jgi:hypothetical protein
MAIYRKEIKLDAGIGISMPPDHFPFSFGATGLTPLWLLCHGEWPIALTILAYSAVLALAAVANVSYAFVIDILGWAIALAFGVEGSKIAWQSRSYGSVRELVNREREWHVIGVIVVCIRIVGSIVLAALWWASVHH